MVKPVIVQGNKEMLKLKMKAQEAIDNSQPSSQIKIDLVNN